jgi:hypothetical protein
MPSEVKDKNDEPIKEGDHVFARSRGGRHEGEVEKIVTSKEEAEKEGVKHPPKVCAESCISPIFWNLFFSSLFCCFKIQTLTFDSKGPLH